MCARRYDYNANKEGLDEVTLAGDLIEASSDDDVAVGYKLTRHVASEKNDLKLTAKTHGTTVYSGSCSASSLLCAVLAMTTCRMTACSDGLHSLHARCGRIDRLPSM